MSVSINGNQGPYDASSYIGKSANAGNLAGLLLSDPKNSNTDFSAQWLIFG